MFMERDQEAPHLFNDGAEILRHSMRTHDYLDRDQEIIYVQQFQAQRRQRLYIIDALGTGRNDPPGPEEIEDWINSDSRIRAIDQTGKNAANQLISHNLRLFDKEVRIAMRRWPDDPIDRWEYFQEAVFGFLAGLYLYDPKFGTKPNSFAIDNAKLYINRYHDNQTSTIRKPVERRQLIRQIISDQVKLAMEWGREPSREELSIRWNMSVKDLQQIYADFERVDSLDVSVSENLETTFGETISDPESGQMVEATEKSIDDSHKRADILNILRAELPDPHYTIVILKHGLDGIRERSFLQVSEALTSFQLKKTSLQNRYYEALEILRNCPQQQMLKLLLQT